MATAPVATVTEREGAASLAPDVLVVLGDGVLRTIDLHGPEVSIGRARDCDVVIDHPSLSRRHAVLRPGPPATVQDLDTTNGTRLCGGLQRGGPPVSLRAGDSFSIGPIAFVLLCQGREITARDLAFSRPSDPPARVALHEAAFAVTQREPLALSGDQAADRDAVLRALEDCAGNQTRAAKQLGISRTTFVTKLKLYRIRRPRT